MANGRLSLFEYSVLVHPTETEAKAGKTTELLVPHNTQLAKNEKAVVLIVAQSLPTDIVGKIVQDLVEIAVRPFLNKAGDHIVCNRAKDEKPFVFTSL